MIVKGFCVSAYNTVYGVVATIFIDDVANLSSMTEIVGMEIEALARGSVAYDKNGDLAIYDGTTWNVVGE